MARRACLLNNANIVKCQKSSNLLLSVDGNEMEHPAGSPGGLGNRNSCCVGSSPAISVDGIDPAGSGPCLENK